VACVVAAFVGISNLPSHLIETRGNLPHPRGIYQVILENFHQAKRLRL
jgi:hypothetical protein